VSFTPQRPSAEGIEIKSEEALSPLLELRKKFGRKTSVVHGDLKTLQPGDEGYEMPAGSEVKLDAAPLEVSAKADVDGA
jgi:hypothetical protein